MALMKTHAIHYKREHSQMALTKTHAVHYKREHSQMALTKTHAIHYKNFLTDVSTQSAVVCLLCTSWKSAATVVSFAESQLLVGLVDQLRHNCGAM